MIKQKLSKKNWFIISLFCFMGGIAWNTENMYFNTFITNEIYADVSQAAILGSMEATTAIARMVALSAVAAVVTTFIMGALSDKLRNRKMFISVGYILWGIVTAMFGFITKENVAVVEVLDFIREWDVYSDLSEADTFEKVKDYIKKQGITKKDLLDAAVYFPGKVSLLLVKYKMV